MTSATPERGWTGDLLEHRPAAVAPTRRTVPSQRRALDDGGYGVLDAQAPTPGFVIPLLEPEEPVVTPVITAAPAAMPIAQVRDTFASVYAEEGTRTAYAPAPLPPAPTGFGLPVPQPVVLLPVTFDDRAHRARASVAALGGLVALATVAAGSVQYFGVVDLLGLLGI
ncbi:hypothetical protein [Actinotalea sp.]|uniref:hypothetical protein n=1 Tax=Actinotalea sp. TaxID=1872145 RepID=UPI003563DF90